MASGARDRDAAYTAALSSIGLRPVSPQPRLSQRQDKSVSEALAFWQGPWFYLRRHRAGKDTLGRVPKLVPAMARVCCDADDVSGPPLIRAQRTAAIADPGPPVLPATVIWDSPRPGDGPSLLSSQRALRRPSRRTFTVDVGSPPAGITPQQYLDLAALVWRRVNDADWEHEGRRLSDEQRRKHGRKARPLRKKKNAFSVGGANTSADDLTHVIHASADTGARAGATLGTPFASGRGGEDNVRVTLAILDTPRPLLGIARGIATQAVTALEAQKRGDRRV